jgi:hypothetical protein
VIVLWLLWLLLLPGWLFFFGGVAAEMWKRLGTRWIGERGVARLTTEERPLHSTRPSGGRPRSDDAASSRQESRVDVAAR